MSTQPLSSYVESYKDLFVYSWVMHQPLRVIMRVSISLSLSVALSMHHLLEYYLNLNQRFLGMKVKNRPQPQTMSYNIHYATWKKPFLSEAMCANEIQFKCPTSASLKPYFRYYPVVSTLRFRG